MNLVTLFCCHIFFSVVTSSRKNFVTSEKKNVLFIAMDDLRPELEPYARPLDSQALFPNIHTPNIEQLASKSIVFHNAYVQQPLCAPSRASLLTGRRPDTTGVHGFHKNFRDSGGDFTTIPQFFKNNGYYTVGFGKIFHDGEDWNDDPVSWTEPLWREKPNLEGLAHSWRAVPEEELANATLRDTDVADRAIAKLRTIASAGKKPFFLAAGFFKPHLPYVFPEKYLQFYPEESIYLPDNLYVPDKMPKLAWSDYVFLLKFQDIKDLNVTGNFNTTLPLAKILELRRAYYSAITYVDYEIGRLLNELNELDLVEDTVIVFWSDHGYHLGENGEWCKHTAFELSARAPLMFSIPSVTDTRIDTYELVEHVDIFPTVVEAAGHDVPDLCPKNSKHLQLCVEGISLMPLTQCPNNSLKSGAFTQAVRDNHTMAYSLRTKQFRYIEWADYVYGTNQPRWNDIKAKELYDHFKDPAENFNVVHEPEYEAVVSDLSKQIRKGWRNAILKTNTGECLTIGSNEVDTTTSYEQSTESDALTETPMGKTVTDAIIEDATKANDIVKVTTTSNVIKQDRVTQIKDSTVKTESESETNTESPNKESIEKENQKSESVSKPTSEPKIKISSKPNVKPTSESTNKNKNNLVEEQNSETTVEPDSELNTGSKNKIDLTKQTELNDSDKSALNDEKAQTSVTSPSAGCCSLSQTVFISILVSSLSVALAFVFNHFFKNSKFKRTKLNGYRYEKLKGDEERCFETEVLTSAYT